MASYSMADSPAPEGQKEAESKKISFRFCRECSNMLYPKEDRETNTLMFACRTCHFSEEADAACIYRNSLKETIAETPGNVQDVAQDPTVGNHNHNNSDDTSMSFDSAMDTMEDSEGVDVVPAFCTFCGQEILCPICEGPTDRGIMLEADDPEGQKGEQAVEDERRERALSGVGVLGSS
ncbi:DNA-directed RNA polymerase II core subunit rpb9 [Saxophila tyrrhenica]|uniref:DNA-directed RNA polymerase II core subunit rpb9 n=1 Tax=Saxophila tyrrhenica TaxID=1690608 RepID=A0AAV9PR48_9PEZI|nr:DNA-directed RNA polymerase II core subunit rpb9 [Saxophila tyrrhenica]